MGVYGVCMRTALTVAGSDSIGGAGIEADIRAMSVVGVHPAAVITAVTAQNTCGVDGILPISEEFVKLQLESVLKDADVKAIKTGMLYSPGIVETVADILEDHEAPLIVDPVMVATTGASLSGDGLLSRKTGQNDFSALDGTGGFDIGIPRTSREGQHRTAGNI